MIIGGGLDLTHKTVKDAMTPISETFSFDINSKLDMYVPLLNFNLQLDFYFSFETQNHGFLCNQAYNGFNNEQRS